MAVTMLAMIGRRCALSLLGLAQLPIAACSTLTIGEDHVAQYARRGAYTSAGLSLVDEYFAAFDDVAHDADEIRPGLNLRAGYRFHPRVAAELTLQNYVEFDVEIANARDGGVEGQAITGGVKLFFSTSRCQPYALVALGHAETDNSSGVGADGSDLAVVAGFGADYYLDANVALLVEAAYYHLTGDTGDFDFVPFTAGVSYRF